MTRPVRFTQADVERALRAARQIDDDLIVRVLPDGSIEIRKSNPMDREAVAPDGKWVP